MLRKAALLFIFCVACDGESEDTATGAASLTAGQELSRHLRGRFDSLAQSKTDPTYFAIQLETCRATVPELGDDVLYVEQASMDTLQAPYRQRVYVIEEIDETTARSRIFEIRGEDGFIGACANAPVTGLSASALVEKPGCAVEMTWDGKTFSGGTLGTDCETDINGAAYATSEITIDADTLESWDRGFFDDDTQAWGAVDGPYIFDRQTALEDE
ncbi:MAG: chromophore lyase CpcT/CpeT [Myxococcota bacterium]